MKGVPRTPAQTVKVIVREIERLAGDRAKAVRAELNATMAQHRKTFEAGRRVAEAAEKEALKKIERDRVNAIAAVDPSHPAVVLSDIASVKADIPSVKRQTVAGAVVSLPRLSCLEKSA